MNIIQIAGHLGADPETRVSPDGTKRTTLRVATNIRRKDRDETVWWRVTIWGDRYDKMLTYLKKGSAVFVLGTLAGKPEIYTDKQGQQQVSLEIWAEIVSFSPFGKPDKGPEQQTQGYSAGGAPFSQMHQAAGAGSMPYNGDSFGTPSYGKGSFGGASQGSMGNQSGHKQNHPEPEEDPLPF